MTDWYVGGLASKAPFYARVRDAETGLYLNTSSQTYVELAAGTLGQFSFAATQVAGANLWKVAIPAYSRAASDHVVELIRGTITSESITDTKHSERLQSKSIYHADIKLNIDEANEQDEYTITWFKNGVRVTSGITSPTLQVVKRSDGTDLIASTTPTQIASTGSYKYDATGSSRMTAGQDALAIVGATIDGSARTFADIVGRDSSA